MWAVEMVLGRDKCITRPSRLFRADGPPPDALVRAPLMAGVSWIGVVLFWWFGASGLGLE